MALTRTQRLGVAFVLGLLVAALVVALVIATTKNRRRDGAH